MIQNIYQEYKDLGLQVIPIEWDIETKQPVSHRNWSEDKDFDLLPKHNALMIKTSGIIHCLDFDIKNTQNKNLYWQWQNAINNIDDTLIGKLYIEQTRNSGYHVWFKYPKNLSKLSLAQSDTGGEVIALYASGPLVYTYPTPGYQQHSGSMDDLIELTPDEYNVLIQMSQYYNEYKPIYDPALKAVSYPVGMEQFCSDFDTKISDDTWELLLKEVDLNPFRDYKYKPTDKFRAFKRRGSDTKVISAKVFYKRKRVMIFSASMEKFPNWHNKHEYPVWCLPPSFLLFYKHNRSWDEAIKQMQIVADSEGIELAQRTEYVTDYPMHVFPDEIRESILQVAKARSLAPQFLATAGLWTISSLAGTQYTSEFNGDSKCILFALMIAPVSVGKTPAYKSMCESPLKEIMESSDRNHNDALQSYNERKAEAGQSKQPFTDRKPRRFIPFAVDGTTEGYVVLSMDQPNGLGVYHDEAETILNAGAFKANNDAVSFFTQAFSGGRYTQIRADRDKERVVPNLNINLLMGTQPSRLVNIFTADRLSSGFASRFLMVESDYIELYTETDPFEPGRQMCEAWRHLLHTLFRSAEAYNVGDIPKRVIEMTPEAKDLYRELYRRNLREANERILSKAEQYVIGTEAKMSTYLPRLIQILAIMHNPDTPVICHQIVNFGYELYKYYAGETIRIIGRLHDEFATGLPAELELLYQSLPDTFTRKEAREICIRLNFRDRKFDDSLRRKDFGKMFKKDQRGTYVKL